MSTITAVVGWNSSGIDLLVLSSNGNAGPATNDSHQMLGVWVERTPLAPATRRRR